MSSRGAILLIDDNRQVVQAIVLALDCAGYRVDAAASPQEAFSLLARNRYDAILLDLNFTQGQTSGAEGFACLARILANDPAAAVVVITAHSGIRLAVAAMQAGALDVVMKPWRNSDLVAHIEAAIAKRRRPASSAIAAPPEAMATTGLHRLLGECPAIVEVRNHIRRIAPTPASVIVSGPAGSGRSLVAALLHEGSLHVDTTAITVDARDLGVWERIDQATGTLILRHIDQLDEVAQARLLDRLTAQLRTIAIVEDVGRLAPRLRGRLGTIQLALPPLATRQNDALLLARFFVAAAAERHCKPVPILTASAEALILTKHWSDEVRGLAQAVERAVLLQDDGVIDAASLTPHLVGAVEAAAVPRRATAPLDVSLEESERVMIEAALRHHHHNVSNAAAALGISRQSLYRRMARYDL